MSFSFLFFRVVNNSLFFFLINSYKLVVVGGGAGGCSVAAKFSALLPQGNVAIVEPADVCHFLKTLYQQYFLKSFFVLLSRLTIIKRCGHWLVAE